MYVKIVSNQYKEGFAIFPCSEFQLRAYPLAQLFKDGTFRAFDMQWITERPELELVEKYHKAENYSQYYSVVGVSQEIGSNKFKFYAFTGPAFILNNDMELVLELISH